MSTELDPIFLKALKLLQSRSRDALDQLKQMTDEAIALRRGELALKKLEDEGKQEDSKHGYKGSSLKRDFDRKRESEKRSLEKLKEDLSFMMEDPIPLKKAKLESTVSESKHKESSKDRERSRESSKESSHRDRREEKDSHKPTLKEDPSWLDFGHTEVKSKKTNSEQTDRRFIIGGSKVDSDSSEEEADGSSFPGLDAEQFATDMMDLACVVCKQIDMTSGNRLLDCQECHRLYHQECHRPAVTDDVDDPRFVWYCSKCSKNMKKMVKAQKPKSNQSSSSRDRETTSAPTKAFKPEPTTQTPFRRMDAGKSSGSSKEANLQSSSSSSRPYTGLASLAANLSSKSHESKSSRGSDSSSGKQPSSSSHSSKSDNSKGLGFLFKPDAHKITNITSQKSSSSSGEKAGLYKMSSGSSKSSSGGKSSSSSSSSSAKPTGISLLAKSGSGSSLSKTTSSGHSAPRSSSNTATSGGHSLARSNSNTAVTSSSGGSKNLSNSSMMSADKKLQMMKRKAAARAAEKKSYR